MTKIVCFFSLILIGLVTLSPGVEMVSKEEAVSRITAHMENDIKKLIVNSAVISEDQQSKYFAEVANRKKIAPLTRYFTEVIKASATKQFDSAKLLADADDIIVMDIQMFLESESVMQEEFDGRLKVVLASMSEVVDEAKAQKAYDRYRQCFELIASTMTNLVTKSTIVITPGRIPDFVKEKTQDLATLLVVDPKNIPHHISKKATDFQLMIYSVRAKADLNYFLRQYINDCIYVEGAQQAGFLNLCLKNYFYGSAGYKRIPATLTAISDDDVVKFVVNKMTTITSDGARQQIKLNVITQDIASIFSAAADFVMKPMGETGAK